MKNLKIAAGGLCLALPFAAYAEDTPKPSPADQCVSGLSERAAAHMPGEEEQLVLISGQVFANIKTNCEKWTNSPLVTMKDVEGVTVLKPGKPSGLVIE